jgi:hypothetical protein
VEWWNCTLYRVSSIENQPEPEGDIFSAESMEISASERTQFRHLLERSKASWHRGFECPSRRQGVYAVSGSPGPIRIVPNGLISRLEPASSWGDLLAQAENLQNLARNRRDTSFRCYRRDPRVRSRCFSNSARWKGDASADGSFARCNASTEKGLRCEQNSQEWSRCPF